MTSQAAVALRTDAAITELPRPDAGALMEQVIVKGDLSKLEPLERAHYYQAVCRSLGLNPLTRPFLYVQFQDGGLQLYPRKEAADQLRGLHKVQTRIVDQRVEQGIFIVTIEARHPDGRVETDIGAVPIQGLGGLFLANAMKKAITQGKRRATLAMLGLSLIDDDEIRAIKGARFVEADPESGEVIDPAQEVFVETEDAADPTPPPHATPDAKIVNTWLGNIDRAKNRERLDTIRANLANLGMDEVAELASALSYRYAEFDDEAPEDDEVTV
jgi:hypothetical protein